MAVEVVQKMQMRPCDTLTRRQREVVDLVTMGYTNPQIAKRIGVTKNVIKNHVRDILDKTGMHSRLQVALWRLSRGK